MRLKILDERVEILLKLLQAPRSLERLVHTKAGKDYVGFLYGQVFMEVAKTLWARHQRQLVR